MSRVTDIDTLHPVMGELITAFEMSGLSVREFAQKSKVKRSTVFRLMSGGSEPRFSDVDKMAQALRLELRLVKKPDKGGRT